MKKIPIRAGMAPVEFRLGPGHTIRGRLVDHQGKPVAFAPVEVAEWRGHASLKWSDRTDAEGRFRWDGAPADVVSLLLQQNERGVHRIEQVRPDGPEVSFQIVRPLHLRGRVTDAETRRTIKAFRIVPGGSWGGSGPILWYDDLAREVFGVSYEMELKLTIPYRLIRIEAEGYEPAVSERFDRETGESIVSFALKRGPGFSGRVRLPDGTPIEGAQVVLATGVSGSASIQNGRVLSGNDDIWVTKTWASGQFDLPATKPPFTVVALHKRGVARVDVDARTRGDLALTLCPWGRIEGVLRFGSRPVSNEPVVLDPRDESAHRDRIFWSGWTRTDGDGRFAFECVPPGPARLSRQVVWEEGFVYRGASPAAELSIEPGKTVRLILGANGRPIVGKAIVPDGIGDVLFGRGELAIKPGDPKTPPFLFRVEPNGSFRIESIEPGTYEIRIVAYKRPAGGLLMRRSGLAALASMRREFTVGPIPVGSSDQPIDLGAIRLEASKS